MPSSASNQSRWRGVSAPAVCTRWTIIRHTAAQPESRLTGARRGSCRQQTLPYWVTVSIHPIGNESAPIQVTQCRFPGLAISNAKILIFFSNKIYRSNFIKQHSETVMAWNYQNADCSLRNEIIVRYDTRCYFNVRSKADMSQLNLPHENDN